VTQVASRGLAACVSPACTACELPNRGSHATYPIQLAPAWFPMGLPRGPERIYSTACRVRSTLAVSDYRKAILEMAGSNMLEGCRRARPPQWTTPTEGPKHRWGYIITHINSN
jgi:hypothetical protein